MCRKTKPTKICQGNFTNGNTLAQSAYVSKCTQQTACPPLIWTNSHITAQAYIFWKNIWRNIHKKANELICSSSRQSVLYMRGRTLHRQSISFFPHMQARTINSKRICALNKAYRTHMTSFYKIPHISALPKPHSSAQKKRAACIFAASGFVRTEINARRSNNYFTF